MSRRGLPHIEPARPEDTDLGLLLDFIESDITVHPRHLQSFDVTLYHRLESLVGDVDVDLDAPLSVDVQ